MKCPWCFSKTRIIDTREIDDGQMKRRRHQCVNKKQHRFSTYEIYDGDFEQIKKYQQIIDVIDKGKDNAA